MNAPPSVLAGSANPHKLTEIRDILSGYGVEVAGPGILPSPVRVVEDGETFEDNARLKALGFARAAAGLSGETRPAWVVCDDSGLCVDALGGAPGVRSARFAGPGATDRKNNLLLLERLSGVKPADRGAMFVSTVACAAVPAADQALEGEEPRVLFVTRGECRGRILETPRGEGGFGYDPLFFFPELGKTYAELDAGEKNRISHRARALERFAVQFREVLEARGALEERTGS